MVYRIEPSSGLARTFLKRDVNSDGFASNSSLPNRSLFGEMCRAAQSSLISRAPGLVRPRSYPRRTVLEMPVCLLKSAIDRPTSTRALCSWKEMVSSSVAGSRLTRSFCSVGGVCVFTLTNAKKVGSRGYSSALFEHVCIYKNVFLLRSYLV